MVDHPRRPLRPRRLAIHPRPRRPPRQASGIDDSSLQEGPALVLEDEAGETAAGEGAGIDADAVLLHVRRLGDGVAVDDDLAVVVAAVEEAVADPEAILRDLRV